MKRKKKVLLFFFLQEMKPTLFFFFWSGEIKEEMETVQETTEAAGGGGEYAYMNSTWKPPEDNSASCPTLASILKSRNTASTATTRSTPVVKIQSMIQRVKLERTEQPKHLVDQVVAAAEVTLEELKQEEDQIVSQFTRRRDKKLQLAKRLDGEAAVPSRSKGKQESRKIAVSSEVIDSWAELQEEELKQEKQVERAIASRNLPVKTKKDKARTS